MNQTYLGIDIGGTKCAAVLGKGEIPAESAGGLIIDKISFPTRQPRGWQAVTAELLDTADRLLAKNNISRDGLRAVGISCGGPLDSRTGTVNCPPNLPDWDNVPITAMFRERFGVPAFLQNDANACALAEWRFGAGRGYDNLIFLTFGTGMGAGLILDGRLYAGTNDLAGEVGHIRLDESGPVGYGKAGSFEGFCSGGGIASLAKSLVAEAVKVGKPTALYNRPGDMEAITAKTVAEAAGQGDALALEIYRLCGEYLGRGLAVLIDILNPQAIVIGSIFERSGNLLVDSMRKTLEAEALPGALERCEILPAALGEFIGDFAALGVAMNSDRTMEVES